jgi:GAF domain-containing protein
VPAKRVLGEDLIAELFDACGDLQFLSDPLEGADFIVALALDKIPSEIGLVSFFDVNRRELVLVRQLGGAQQVLLARISEHAPLARAAFRANRAIVVPDSTTDSRVLSDDRWTRIGVTPRSVMCAPVQSIGRFLGLVEIANPLDGSRYTNEDGNALTYIGQQLAEFLAAREVVIDPARVMKDAQKGRR